MSRLFRLSVVLASLLVALTGCELFNGINLAWSIESVTPSVSSAHVTYTVRNLGKYDLTGVNLEIGVDVHGDGTYPRSAWTPDFSIGQGQVLYGSLDVYTGTPPIGWATVISVDMDKPKG
jgi:hypothetical protein